jgi:hypothetical protein
MTHPRYRQPPGPLKYALENHLETELALTEGLCAPIQEVIHQRVLPPVFMAGLERRSAILIIIIEAV